MRALSEDIIALLSNLGAISEKNAVGVELLANSRQLANIPLDEELSILEVRGYVKRVGDKLYLTEAGLVRALSRLS